MPDKIDFQTKATTRNKKGTNNSISECLSKKTQNTKWKRYLHSYVIVGLFTIAKIWKQPKCPSISKWIKKWCSLYTQ